MKEGLSLVQLATEVQRQNDAKRDFVAPSPLLIMSDDAKHIEIKGAEFGIREYAQGQIATYTGIDKRYYDRMRSENPALAAYNVNSWLRHEEYAKDKRLVRTLDGEVRGFLSDTYRPLENFDLAQVALPLLHENRLQVHSANVTETRLYIKGTSPRLEGEVKKGEVVQGGVCLRNSEVGHGAWALELFVYILTCLNGAIAENVMRKAHLGKKIDMGDNVEEYIRDDTRKAEDKALFMRFRDTLDAMLKGDRFAKWLERAQGTTKQQIKKPLETIEVTAKRYQLTELEREAMMKHLIEGGDLTQWGLSNAITRTAHDVESYERATELERLGGQIIELPKTEWEAIAA